MKTKFFYIKKIIIFSLTCIAIFATALFGIFLNIDFAKAENNKDIDFNLSPISNSVKTEMAVYLDHNIPDDVVTNIRKGAEGELPSDYPRYNYSYYEVVIVKSKEIDSYYSTLPFEKTFEIEYENTISSSNGIVDEYNVDYARFTEVNNTDLLKDSSNHFAFNLNSVSVGDLGLTLRINESILPDALDTATYFYYVIVNKVTHYYANYTTSASTVRGSSRTEENVYKSNFIQFNFNKELTAITENESSSDLEIKVAQSELGVYNENGIASVNVKYLKMKDAGAGTSYADYEEIIDTKAIPSLYLQNKSKVFNLLLNNYSATNISYFNAVYKGYYYDESVEGYVKTQEKIIRQATDYTYSYDNVNQTATLEIIYSDYNYKDLALRVTNNDINNLLTLDVYTANVTTENDIVTLTWNYSDIESQLYNRCRWLFTLTADNVSVAGINEGVTVNSNAVLDNEQHGLQVTFNTSNQSDLFGLNLVAVANIIPDKEYTVTYKYLELDNDLNVTERTSEPFTMLMSEFVRFYDAKELFATKYPDAINIINQAISPAVLNGEKYYTYNTITLTDNYDDAVASITVLYTKNALIKVTNNLNTNIIYRALTKNSVFYSPEDFYFTIPAGYRCDNITAVDGVKVSSFDLENFDNTLIDTSGVTAAQRNAGAVIELAFNLTDKWNVNIAYLQRYENTCFAEKKVFVGQVSVLEYGYNLQSLTIKEIASILGLENLNILKSLATARTVEFDNATTYNITVQYSEASMIQTDYDGNRKELKLPITSFYDWKVLNNLDYSLGGLNTQDVIYFPYTTLREGMTVEESEKSIFGYFGVAVFEEQNIDLNYYFRNTTGDGCAVINKSKEIFGSDLYKFLNSDFSKFAFSAGGALIGGVTGAFAGAALNFGMLALCEVTDNSNCIRYSYFFYLDCTSSVPFISNGGADDAYDDDSAFDNAGQDFIGNVADAIGGCQSGVNDIWNSLKWVVYAIVIATAIIIIIKVAKK